MEADVDAASERHPSCLIILSESSDLLHFASAYYEKLRMIVKTHERIRVQYDGKFHLGDPCLW